MNGCFVHLIMNQGRNTRPVTFYFGVLEMPVESNASIAFNTY